MGTKGSSNAFLINFAIFTGKHKKETSTHVYSYEYCETLMNNYFEEYLRTTASMVRDFLEITVINYLHMKKRNFLA